MVGNTVSDDETVQERLESTALDDVDAHELTQMMRTLLRERYTPSKGWHLFEEVSGGGRQVDAVAVNAWPSRGYEVHGFELKATRSDWLSELDDAKKAKWWFNHCDRWWLVAPTHVADQDEIPKSWGWLRFESHGQLRKVVAAPETDAVTDDELIGVFARQLAEAWDDRPAEQELEDARLEGYNEGYEAGKREAKSLDKRTLESKVERLEGVFDEFEDKTGVTLGAYLDREDIHDVVGAIVDTRRGGRKAARDLVRVKNRMEVGVDELDALLDDVPFEVKEDDAGQRLGDWGDWW